MRMHPFQMREYDPSVEGVAMHRLGVLYNSVRHGLLVVTSDLISAPRTCLLVTQIAAGHERIMPPLRRAIARAQPATRTATPPRDSLGAHGNRSI